MPFDDVLNCYCFNLNFSTQFLPRCMECSRGIAMGILSVRLSVCLSVRLSVRLSVCLSVRLSVCLSVRPSVCQTRAL